MIELDGDEIRISSRGRYAERDIVQVWFHVLFLKCFQIQWPFWNGFIFLNWLKHKNQSTRGQQGVTKPSDIRRIDLERQGSAIFFFMANSQNNIWVPSGVVQNCHLVTSTPGCSGPQMAWCAHTRSKWHSPSICEESAKSASFSLKQEFRQPQLLLDKCGCTPTENKAQCPLFKFHLSYFCVS